MLRDAIPEARYRFAAAWLFYTGCRVSEACSALQGDVRKNGDPEWPLLWDCRGRGFARVDDYCAPITPHTINSALERARDAIGLTVNVTAHVAKHSYCSNWINDLGTHELAMEKLSRQAGTSVANLRKTYVHIALTDDDWRHIKSFGQFSA